MARVLVTEAVHPDALALLRAGGCEVVAEAAPGTVEAILVRTRKLAPEDMGGRLRVISKHGVGVDNIPLDAARAAGIAVTNTPGANAVSVAEHAMMLILALAKCLPGMVAAARSAGRLDPALPVHDLEGRRLLVVGFGQSGRRLAAMAAAFGMTVTVHSPRLTGPRTAEGHRIAPDLRAALAEADVLSLHCPLTPATRGLIGRAELAALPAGAIVVNTARGGLIDEVALAEAAQDHLGGFGLDVLEAEPVRPDEPLLALPNGIVTPHSAGVSAEAFRRMGMDAAQNVLDALAGRLRPDRVVVAPR